MLNKLFVNNCCCEGNGMKQEKSGTLAFSVLLTKDEYVQTTARIQQEARSRNLPLPTAVGALLTAMGIAGLFFGDAISLSRLPCIPFRSGLPHSSR